MKEKELLAFQDHTPLETRDHKDNWDHLDPKEAIDLRNPWENVAMEVQGALEMMDFRNYLETRDLKVIQDFLDSKEMKDCQDLRVHSNPNDQGT